MFKRNESKTDRLVRAVAGAALVVVAFAGLDLTSGAVLGIVVAVVGAILLFTAATGVCLLYSLLGLNTSKSRSKSL